MKKFKTFLCSIFMLAFALLSLPACKTNNDNNNNTPTTPTPATPTEVTIQLNEAKSMIVDSLESDTIKLQNAGIANSTSVGNRNIFVKLKTANIQMLGDFDMANEIKGTVQRNKDNWTKYSLESGDYYGYYDGTNVYDKRDNSYTTSTFEESYFGGILQLVDCIYIDLLFIENAWVSIYEDTATKTAKDYGFALTMNVNMPSYVDFVMAECYNRGLGDSSEALFGDGEYRQKNKELGSLQLTVRFDKYLNIIGLDMTVTLPDFNNGEQVGFYDTTFIVNKAQSEVTAPEWFNIDNYTNEA